MLLLSTRIMAVQVEVGKMVGQVEVGMLVGEKLVVGMRVVAVWLVVGGEVATDMEVGALGKRWDTEQRQRVEREGCTSGSCEWS